MQYEEVSVINDMLLKYARRGGNRLDLQTGFRSGVIVMDGRCGK